MQNYVENRRYFFLAVNTGFTTNGVPDERCRQFYHARSGNGLHCAIVGNVVTPRGLGTNDVCSEISESHAWRELATTISSNGALAGIQLSSTWEGYKGNRRFVPRAGEHPISEYRTFGNTISYRQVMTAFDALHRGTELAVKAGFRHVQLHAAHGYLFNILVDRRLSSYAELTQKLICRWAEGLASERIETSIRFSIWTGDSHFDQDRSEEFADEITLLPVDYIDVSAGFYNINKRLIYPSTSLQLKERADATLSIASRNPLRNFIISGKSMGAWDVSLPKNIHIGICRDLIANPNYLADRADGCVMCMKCHYFSRGEAHIDCGRW